MQEIEKLLEEIKGSETLASESGRKLDDNALNAISGGNVIQDLKEFWKWLGWF